MSLWDWFQDWRIGGAAAALLLSLFVLQFSAQAPKLSTSGWTIPNVNGLYSRVSLFIKNAKRRSEVSQVSTGGGVSQVSQVAVTNGASHFPLPDLVVEVPLDYFGVSSKYKYCLPDESVLKRKAVAKAAQVSETKSCKLQLSPTTNSEVDEGVINYLLEVITKWISIQHAANMVMFYDDKLTFSGSTQKLKKVTEQCGITSSQDKDVLKEFFLQSTKNSKKCLPSPTSVELNLRLPTESNSENDVELTKDKLSKGNLFGVLKYGIFDYWTTDLVKAKEEQKGKNIKVNWPILLSLTDSGLDSCSFDSFHKAVLRQQLKIEELARCSYSAN